MDYLTPKRRIKLEQILRDGVEKAPGEKGDPGDNGKSIEFVWNDTQLGVRLEGQTVYQYVNLKGEPGNDGYTPVKGIDYFDGAKGDPGESGSDANVTNANVISAIGYTPVSDADARLSDERTPINHNLVDTTKHPVSGLTTGHFLRANSATTYGFSALPTSSTSAQGIVELATLTEVSTGTDTARAVTPQGVKQETNKCAKLTVGALPTASATYRSQFFVVQGGVGVADKIYVCMKNADDTYSWEPLLGFSW